MIQLKYKIGYCIDGGIFVGKKIESDFHKHHSIAIVLSYKEPFELIDGQGESYTYEAVLIPKDISYKLSTRGSAMTVFIHMDPYSEMGIALTQSVNEIQGLNRSEFLGILNNIKDWYEAKEDSILETDVILQSVTDIIITSKKLLFKKIDSRILKCIHLIKNSDLETIRLKELAEQVFISESRLSHLFKKETGLTFREFLLHSKMVKALYAIYNQENLSDVAFLGGFTDQPHFIKSFRKIFGIKPSTIKL